ncbi:flagellar motor switch phosphatase FliY [Cytobacillus sp. S13-E01]|uniref:flagellar motor switch phosphatase FliY n=1 Tax=Cytobacillus sp. S13-E01 TaxID=3031326 RepID=UPI0023D7F6CF|nr:flagellar motor switch phosphatase FliY [Cytobacillus sp. S13-E01]MDF0725177.1 flagellar motor switch phosphatase FliY [Cytobacillus sp. S13-E01]
MSDMLSQDEIDALLRGTTDFDNDDEDNGDRSPVEDYLTSMEEDALGEIGNISFGSSATALSTLLNQKVDITTPSVLVVQKSKLSDEFPQPYVAIHVSYTEGFTGANLLVIKQSDAAIIADLMLGGDGKNPADLLGEIQLSAVQEAMNQMMGSAATSMSTVFNKKVDISPPSIDLLDLKEGEGAEKIPSDETLVKISFRLKIGDLIDSNIMQVIPVEFAKALVDELLNPSALNEVAPTAQVDRYEPAVTREYSSQAMQQSREYDYAQPSIHQQPTQPMYGTGHPQQNSYSGPQHIGSNFNMPSAQPTSVQPAVFSNFEQVQLGESEAKNLDMLLDIPLQVTVELGRTKRSIKEILELSTGSIIELDKLAGEPVDVLVNNKLVAKGEVVVIDENFGVRITDIISQKDRINKLR